MARAPGAGPDPSRDDSLRARRERASRLAATWVAVALGVAGLTLAAFAVLLVLRGGWQFLFLSLLLLVVGLALAGVGFFFQLVPFRLAELAGEKRARDDALREARAPDGPERE